MPWVLNKSAYIETDILKIVELEGGYFLTNYLKRVVESYQAYRQPDTPPLYPPVEEVMPLIDEWEKVHHISDYDPKASEKRKRKQAIFKELRPKVQLWGVYMVMLVEEKKIDEFRTGFPYLWMYSLRRPTSVSSFYVQRNKTGTTTMICSKKPALQLFFYWQASEDNQNWFTIARTSLPSLTTTKLDPNKKYYFRMYMKNPKGKSDMHERRWEGAK